MRVLGIDPGTIQMGTGVLEAEKGRHTLVNFEVIRIPKNLALPQRLRTIYESVQRIIERERPSVMALENVFFGKDVRALVKMGEARASAMLAAEECGIPVVEYPPARVKEAVSGNGRASKIQIQRMMKNLLSLSEEPPPDAADALAVALCHLQTQSTLRIYENARV